MMLTPRYGDSPPISIEVRTPGPHPVVRQRQRLVATLRDLPEDAWQRPSRCEGWTVQDVATHLVSTNGFWALSIQAGLGGEPTRFLATFDPVATPAQLVDREAGTAVADTLEQLAASTDGLAAVIDGLTDADWDALAESPPGHVPIRVLADHALWDCWVHERDILLPLGLPATVEDDEVLTCLRYGAGLGRALEVCSGTAAPGAVALEVHEPDARIVVEVKDDVVRVHDRLAVPPSSVARGEAVEILEMLSMRDVGAPAPPVVRELTAGLATVFDQPDAVGSALVE